MHSTPTTMDPSRRVRLLAQHLQTPRPGPTAAAAPEDTVVAVTGCTSGLGLHLCLEFLRRGYKVSGCGRRADIIDELNAEHSGSGSGRMLAVQSKRNRSQTGRLE